MVFEQGAGVKPMEQYMEHESDSTKPHSHSYSEQAHGSDDDSTSPDKTKPKRDHSSTPHVNRMNEKMRMPKPVNLCFTSV